MAKVSESNTTEQRLHSLEQFYERLSKELDKIESNEKEDRIEGLKEVHKVKEEIEEKLHQAKENIDEKITSTIKTQIAWMGAIITIIGALGGILGYMGAKDNIAKSVNEKIGTNIVLEVSETKKQAHQLVEEITAYKKASAQNPLIILQTDYGANSAYLGSLLGSIYKINPNARVQVTTDGISSFDIKQAAWRLWRSAREFPPGTIFVAITNPGGITVPRVVVETNNGLILVGHDNGIFDLIINEFGYKSFRSIGGTASEIKDLYGGTEIFGPAAGKISLGLSLDTIGNNNIKDYHAKLNIIHKVGDIAATGMVMDVDNYGNVMINLSENDLKEIGKLKSGLLHLSTGKTNIELPLEGTYGDVPYKSLVAVIYDGYLQLAINSGNFNERYKMAIGTKLTIY